MFALLVCLNLIVRTVLTQTVGNDMRQQTRTSFLFYSYVVFVRERRLHTRTKYYILYGTGIVRSAYCTVAVHFKYENNRKIT